VFAVKLQYENRLLLYECKLCLRFVRDQRLVFVQTGDNWWRTFQTFQTLERRLCRADSGKWQVGRAQVFDRVSELKGLLRRCPTFGTLSTNKRDENAD
jgi:hypothetical protein